MRQTFGSLVNEIFSEYAATSATAKRTGSTSVASQIEKDKAALFRDLEKEEADYVKTLNTARLTKYKEEMGLRADAVKAQQALTRSLLESGTKLTVAQLKANADLAKNYQTTMAKLATSYDSRGADWLDRNIADAIIQDESLRNDPVKLEQVIGQAVKAGWDSRDPATLGLMARMREKFGERADGLAGAEIVASAADQAQKKEAFTKASEKIASAKIPPGGLTQEGIDGMVMELQGVTMNAPVFTPYTQDELKDDTRYQELEKRRGEGTGSSSASQDEQAAKILLNPHFRAWAKDHGFEDIGEMSDEGQYRFGKDSARALSVAADEAGGGTRKPKVVEPISLVVRQTPTPDRFAFVPQADGSYAAYVQKGDGTQVYTDFKGEDQPVDLAKMQADLTKADGTIEPFNAIGVEGGIPLSATEVAKRISAGTFDPEKMTDDEKKLEPLVPEVHVEGGRLRLRAGDDPDRTVRVYQPNGNIVTLHREKATDDWQIVEGEVQNPTGIELGEPRLVKASKMEAAPEEMTAADFEFAPASEKIKMDTQGDKATHPDVPATTVEKVSLKDFFPKLQEKAKANKEVKDFTLPPAVTDIEMETEPKKAIDVGDFGFKPNKVEDIKVDKPEATPEEIKMFKFGKPDEEDMKIEPVAKASLIRRLAAQRVA